MAMTFESFIGKDVLLSKPQSRELDRTKYTGSMIFEDMIIIKLFLMTNLYNLPFTVFVSPG